MINKFNETVYIKSHAAKNKNDYVGRTFYGILFILHVSVSDLISSFCYFFPCYFFLLHFVFEIFFLIFLHLSLMLFFPLSFFSCHSLLTVILLQFCVILEVFNFCFALFFIFLLLVALFYICSQKPLLDISFKWFSPSTSLTVV